MQYFQEQLPVIPGKTRNAKIYWNLISNLLVYSLGGRSLMKLFESYKSMYPNEKDQIGKTSFIKAGKMLCTKGEIKKGLFPYYV